MFNKSSEPTLKQELENMLLSQLKETTPGSPEFTAILDQYDKLHKTNPVKESWWKPDLLIPVFGNFAGILAILNYERVHVVSSKALTQLMKIRF
jgi:hypothetical protein